MEITKKEVKKFLKTHRDMEFSPEKLEYSLYLHKGIDGMVLNALGGNTCKEDIEQEATIRDAASGEELLQLMRKELSACNRYELRQKLLENEDLVMPLIKEKCLTNRQDHFIENAVYFFLYCKTNVSDWITENYSHFKSECLKSMFCLILGFRCEKELIPFLISEAKRFERYYPDETFDQGPVLAVQELAKRFF